MANYVFGGFRWVKTRRGSNDEPREARPVASGYGTAIFKGDAVKKLADGTIAVAAAGDAVYAIADGVKQMKVAGKIEAGNYLPAGTTYSGAAVITNPQASVVYCIPVVGQVFEAAVNATAASAAAAEALVGSNFDLHAGAGGSTGSGQSSHVVDNATAGTATAQLRLIEIQTDPANQVTNTLWRGLFEFNEGTEPSATTATGV